MEPSDVTAALTEEVDRLSALVARLVAIPGEHRDEFLDQFADDDLAIPEARRDAIRDTCDVLGHKLRAVADVPSRPCPTCGSHSRLVRRIPADHDPKSSTPCTDPWHEETP